MSDDKEIGENCTFIFKKRCLKSRAARKRQESSSDEGKVKFTNTTSFYEYCLCCRREK